jgi:DMSO/TMAO reductase YedYZ molybdopterin-dependent catalytic subunit
MRAWPGRITNLALLVVLTIAFATGTGAVAAGTGRSRWIVIAHGVAGIMVVLLIPWKSRIVRIGLRRSRPSRWTSLLLAALALVALAAGLGYSTGLVRSIAGQWGMWVHIAAALLLVPFLVWHALSRPAQARRTDLSRRTLLRAGALATLAGGIYVAAEGAVRVAGLPGTRRRFTGSYAIGSQVPAAMPVTSWIDDPIPSVDLTTWRLTVVDKGRRRSLSSAELTELPWTRLHATLDCTSGWYAAQDWAGVPLATLLGRVGTGHRSIYVHSISGYGIHFPLSDVDSLLLAFEVGGSALSPGHGFPARLVAPGRRGFWWVKWVDRIELASRPWWAQSSFPLT